MTRQKPSDAELAGRANCGCAHHAAEATPCLHDLVKARTERLIDDDDFWERVRRIQGS